MLMKSYIRKGRRWHSLPWQRRGERSDAPVKQEVQKFLQAVPARADLMRFQTINNLKSYDRHFDVFWRVFLLLFCRKAGMIYLREYTGIPERIAHHRPKEAAMAKFIPYRNLTKKRKRAIDREKRGAWGAVNPVTRCAEPSDTYSRSKENRRWQAEAHKEHANHGGFIAGLVAVAA